MYKHFGPEGSFLTHYAPHFFEEGTHAAWGHVIEFRRPQAGEPISTRRGEPRGTPSADLPPSAFVMFLQNHNQTGNRPVGSG